MKNHWITNCPHFKEGDKTAENKADVDCDVCLDKLYEALQDGLVENRIISSDEPQKIEKDPLLQEAKEHSLKKGYVSVSYLQRIMRIGYTRAARLVDLMIADGFCEREREADTSHFRLCVSSI